MSCGIARLEDAHKYVRRTAVRALAQIAEKGNAAATAAVIARLGDASQVLRHVAFQTH